MPVFLSEGEIDRCGKDIEAYRTDLFRQEFLAKVKPFPRVPELFQRMREDGWKLALASSAKKKEIEAYKQICGINDLIDSETSSDDAARSKPFPDIFVAALEKFDCAVREDCIVIGDSPFDAEAAAKAGIPAVGFLCGAFPETELTTAGCRALYWGATDLYAEYESSLLYTGGGRAAVTSQA